MNAAANLASNCHRPAGLGWGFLAVIGLSIGCGASSSLHVPDYDPAASAARAMEMYDKDGDGFIAGAELDGAPGLKAAMKRLDLDADNKISEIEISERLKTWLGTEVALMTLRCEVTLDGAPLEGATVRFVPEPFLKDVIQPAEDVSSIVGIASPRIPKDQRPSPDMPPGIQMGFYRVEISKDQGTQSLIPAKYNTHTILGQEVARDDPAILGNRVRFNLTSK